MFSNNTGSVALVEANDNVVKISFVFPNVVFTVTFSVTSVNVRIVVCSASVLLVVGVDVVDDEVETEVVLGVVVVLRFVVLVCWVVNSVELVKEVYFSCSNVIIE